MWLQAANIPFVHGFSTRHGGVSPAPFDSLNLGGSDDDPANISENRRRAFSELGLPTDSLFTLRQVHGNTVCEALAQRQEGDALVSNKPGSLIAVLIADCYPVLFADVKSGVIGVAHCGWRGTVAGIASKTVEAMVRLGATPENIFAAIGQGISQQKFEVGEEVIAQFTGAGFPQTAFSGRHISLPDCISHDLAQAGVREKHIWVMNRCTFEPDFFSYRRDKAKTGRMMGVIGLQRP